MLSEQFKPIQFAVSSDVAGFTGKMRSVPDIYSEAFPEGVPIELLAFGNTRHLAKNIQTLEQAGYKTVRIHGRTGTIGVDAFDHIKVLLANTRLLSTPKLVHNFSDYQLLVHTDELSRNDSFTSVVEHSLQNGSADSPIFWVENHIGGIKDLNHAVEMVTSLRAHGVPAALMLDICHFIGQTKLREGNFTPIWNQTQNALAPFLAYKTQNIPIIRGLHFPIGTNPKDSLPMDKITDFMLKDFGELCQTSGIEYITLENQVSGLQDSWAMREKSILKVRSRTAQIVDKLRKSGTIFEGL